MAKESYVQRIVKAAGEVEFEEMTPRQRVELILDNFQSDTTVGAPLVQLVEC